MYIYTVYNNIPISLIAGVQVPFLSVHGQNCTARNWQQQVQLGSSQWWKRPMGKEETEAFGGIRPEEFIRILELVGGWFTPLKNMSSSIGMTIPKIWDNKKWPPNHQPV